MAIIPSGSDSLTAYHGALTKSLYPLTQNGDADVTPQLAETLIRLEAGKPADNADQAREDAEATAQYILGIPSTPNTESYQLYIGFLLPYSQLSDEALEAEGLDRESVTSSLTGMNDAFLETQRMERRVPVLGLGDV